MKTQAKGPAPQEGEVDLRFGVRRSGSARMSAAISKLPGASRTQVRSLYFDSPGDCLARSGISLELREQAGRRIQTIELRRGTGHVPLRHEVDLGAEDATMPVVDPRLHRGTLAGDLAIELLGFGERAGSALVVRHESVVERTSGRLRWGESEIEAVHDRGQAQASGHAMQISALELVLKQGSVVDLIDSATQWAQRQGLWLLDESKADRGLRLARGQTFPPVAKAGELAASHLGALNRLSSAVLGNCLEQILPNAAALAEGSACAQHVHQLRVGLRRLRTAFRELGLARRTAREIDPSVTKVFRALGEHRDQQHVHDTIERRVLRETEASTANWARTRTDAIDLRVLVRDREFQRALLAVMRLKESLTQDRQQRKVKSRRWLAPRIERLSQRVARSSKRFETLAVEEQHQVRKRLKRLRYLGEFAAPLFPAKRVKRYLQALQPAQDALGLHNDLAVARGMASLACNTDADARLAVAWIAHEQEGTARKAAKKLHKVREAARFW